jgi:hypothetical protein
MRKLSNLFPSTARISWTEQKFTATPGQCVSFDSLLYKIRYLQDTSEWRQTRISYALHVRVECFAFHSRKYWKYLKILCFILIQNKLGEILSENSIFVTKSYCNLILKKRRYPEILPVWLVPLLHREICGNVYSLRVWAGYMVISHSRTLIHLH